MSFFNKKKGKEQPGSRPKGPEVLAESFSPLCNVRAFQGPSPRRAKAASISTCNGAPAAAKAG